MFTLFEGRVEAWPVACDDLPEPRGVGLRPTQFGR